MSFLEERLKSIIFEKECIKEKIQELIEANRVAPSAINMNVIGIKQAEYKDLEYEEIDLNREIKYNTDRDDLSLYDKGCLIFEKILDLFNEFKNTDNDISLISRKISLASKIEKNITDAIAYSFLDYKMFLILGEIQSDIHKSFDYYTTGMVIYKHSRDKRAEDFELLSRINIIDNIIFSGEEIGQNPEIFLKFLRGIRENDQVLLNKNKKSSRQPDVYNYKFINRDELIENISGCFNIEDIKDICFILDIDYDNLIQIPKTAFIRELLNLIKRENRHEELIRILEKKRNLIGWAQYIKLEKNDE